MKYLKPGSPRLPVLCTNHCATLLMIGLSKVYTHLLFSKPNFNYGALCVG